MQLPPLSSSPNSRLTEPKERFQIGALRIESWVCGPLATNAFLLSDSSALQMLLVDPAIESHEAFARAQELQAQGLGLGAIWNTHGHFDHVYDNARWKAAFPSQLWLHSEDAFLLDFLREQSLWFGLSAPEEAQPDRDWKGLSRTEFAGRQVQVLATPGHSPGSVSFYFSGEKMLLCGDVLFKGSVGRTDLPGSDAATLKASLQVLAALPPETLVLCGHGPSTTIGDELQHNPFLQELGPAR